VPPPAGIIASTPMTAMLAVEPQGAMVMGSVKESTTALTAPFFPSHSPTDGFASGSTGVSSLFSKPPENAASASVPAMPMEVIVAPSAVKLSDQPCAAAGEVPSAQSWLSVATHCPEAGSPALPRIVPPESSKPNVKVSSCATPARASTSTKSTAEQDNQTRFILLLLESKSDLEDRSRPSGGSFLRAGRSSKRGPAGRNSPRAEPKR
jgi:hypothetical protein